MEATMDITTYSMGMALGGLFLIIFLFWRSYFYVEEGHLAVLTRFGAAVKNNNHGLALFNPGGHWKYPWDKVITFSIMEGVIDLSGEKSGKYAMAADGTVLRLDSKIRFTPKSGDYYSYLFELKNSKGHIREMFTCLVRNEIANFQEEDDLANEALDSYSIIRRNRKRLNEQVDLVCKNQIGHAYGLQFYGVDLLDIVPPHELESALNGIQNAQTEAETLYARAEGESRQKLAAAEQGVEIAKIRSEAITLELHTLAKTIRKLILDGSINSYLTHRRTEMLGDSKMLFMQKEV